MAHKPHRQQATAAFLIPLQVASLLYRWVRTISESMDKGVSHPACKALLLCENSIIEAGTGRISLINIIHQIPILSFPGQTIPFEAFLQFTDAQGRYEIVVEVRDRDDDTVLARAIGAGIEISDRHATCNVLIPVPSLRLQHEGPYDFVVLANGLEIERQNFAALALDGEDDDDE